jgi:hypothetical protein
VRKRESAKRPKRDPELNQIRVAGARPTQFWMRDAIDESWAGANKMELLIRHALIKMQNEGWEVLSPKREMLEKRAAETFLKRFDFYGLGAIVADGLTVREVIAQLKKEDELS